MAFDGIVVSNIVKELNEKLTGGRILKISQPEKDELVLTIKNYDQYKLYISASAALPLIYITEESKQNPLNAPNFCMLLRKHLNSARILKIEQPGLERVIQIKIEHLDEMGDLCVKYLIVEIMGKHSNIIFCEESLTIIDSIKRISSIVSSVREVLPGRSYFIPKTLEKSDPLTGDFEDFKAKLLTKKIPVGKALYSTYTGISPLVANESCHLAGLDPDAPAASLSEDIGFHLFKTFKGIMIWVGDGLFTPNILYRGNEPLEFSSIPITCYTGAENVTVKSFASISELLFEYYAAKNTLSRIRQKSQDLRRIVSNAIERSTKKYDLQLKQLKDTEKRDKYKIYGELLTTYGYQAEPGATELTVINFYDGNELAIPLDNQYTAIENAKRYFEKYGKLKRTYEALSELIKETAEELYHLESIRTSLDITLKEDDLSQLKEELIEYGYMKRPSALKTGKNGKKKPERKSRVTSAPFHYVTPEDYHIYVGKNNYQNEELTFHFALSSDWWFHSKGIPGSHVILKSKGEQIPDCVFEDAARLAAFYSKGREADKVEIDYAERKNIKKPNGSKPGFVVYYTNYSMMASPDISHLKLLSD